MHSVTFSLLSIIKIILIKIHRYRIRLRFFIPKLLTKLMSIPSDVNLWIDEFLYLKISANGKPPII